MKRSTAGWVAALALAWTGVAPGEPAAGPMKPLDELAGPADVAVLRLTLEGAVYQTGKDGNRSPKNLVVTLVRREGRFEPQAAGSAPDFNKAAHQGRVVDPAAPMNAVELRMNIASDRWVKGDEQAAYRLDLRVDGATAGGDYTGTFQGRPVAGKVTGKVLRPGWYGADVDADGVGFSFDMGTERRNWNHAKWGGYNLFQPVDVSAYDGFVIEVATDRPRSDAWVDLGVMEEDGSWYAVRDAIPLSAAARTVKVAFDDLRHAEFLFNAEGTAPGVDGNYDEDFHFDRTKLYRVAIGVQNPLGVGRVDFTIRAIALAKWKDEPIEPARIDVTGRTIRFNDQATVPAGIFGFHQAGGSAEQVADLRVGSLRPHRAMGYGGAFVEPPSPRFGVEQTISANYDRKQQMPQFEQPDRWQDSMRKAGRGIGEQARPYGDKVAVEWWNEPYLELGKFLEQNMARKVKPGPDTKVGDPVVWGGQPLGSMIWAPKGGTIDGRPWRVGDEQVRDAQGIDLVPIDPTRFTYWSGRQIALWYIQTFNLVAAEAKAIAPELRMVGGFGFRWNEDEWASWHILHKPMIDATIDLLDGVCEHHYQGYTEAMPASYEVLVAYTDAVHGRRIKAYNTETNDLWDAPARGNPVAADQAGRFVARHRMVYNVRDILGVIRWTPDKLETRAIHALWKGGDADPGAPWKAAGINEGEYHALQFLKPLRGRLVEAASSDEDVWAVASIDDERRNLVAVAFNDSPRDRSIELTMPDAFSDAYAGGFDVYRLRHDEEGHTSVEIEDGRFSAPNTFAADLPPAEAIMLVAHLGKPHAGEPDLVRRQFFARKPAADVDPILFEIAPGASQSLRFEPAAAADDARRAWVRVVVERVAEGDGYFTIDGRRYDLPAAYTPANGPYIREVEIDPSRVKPETVIEFHASPPDQGNGYLLCAASIIVEH